MNRLYEVMFIVRPDVVDEDVDKLVAGFEATVTGSGGKVEKIDRLGKRRLAYMIARFLDGNYVLLTVSGSGEMVHELERRLRVSEPVMKFLTVRIDEEQKRLDKVKKIRASRVKRTPAPMAAPAAAPAAEPTPTENTPTTA
ncbi:MAG TPA: 30S ribosomal protein S6 [Terriglobales bacterium]|nr:30S ribosomal protein S6 [Terriglobales bacterium]